MKSLRQDIRFAFRSLRRSPAFALTTVTILAIGLGMSVAMFTVFRTVIVRQLPVVDQNRIAVMWTYRVAGTELAGPAKDLDQIRRRATTMRDIAGVVHWGAVNDAFTNGDRTLSLATTMVTANFFDVLGARPVLGRLFRDGQDDAPPFPADGKPTAPAPLNAVLSYRSWRRDFNGDASVIGRRFVQPLFGQQYTIIGVAPPGLDFPSGAELWTPLLGGWQSGHSTIAVARLKPSASLAAARDEYLSLANRIAPELRATGAHVETFDDTVLGSGKTVVVVLTAAVGLLLLITCLNVGNLVLLRASSRARELGLRRVLGATYGDIVRQLFVEASLLALAGGVLGLGIAIALLRAVILVAPRTLPRVDELAISGPPFFAAVALTGVAMVLFGVLPSVLIARGSTGASLRVDTHTGSETRRRRAIRQTLVASQVALAMITLGGAALIAKSLARLEGQDYGYRSDHLAALSLSWDALKVYTAPKLTELAQRVEQAITAVPGVTAATPTVVPLLIGTGVWQIRVDKEGQTSDEAATNPTLSGEVVGADFFRTFETRVLRGRAFTKDDGATSELVVVVSDGFARRYWPGQNPIGKRVRMPVAQDSFFVGGSGWRRVVGVAEDTRLRTIREVTPILYFPVTQGYWQGYFAIRTSVPVEAMAAALRTAIETAGGGAALQRIDTMDELLAIPLGEPRLSALLMSGFSLVALLLCAIGLYGVMASLVRDQTRDIGIRMALGATPSRVRDDVLGRAARTIGFGVVVGLAGAIFGARLISGLLYDVKPNDPLALATGVAVLLGAGLLAAYIPARRATKIDPVQALRAE